MDSIIDLLQVFWTSIQHGQLPELGPWNYLLLSLLIVVQGPLATLMGGAVAAAGLLRPGLVLVAGIMGNLAADVLWYSVGTRGRIDSIVRYTSRLGVRRSHIESLQSNLRRHAPIILLLAKLSAGFAVPALLAAGLSRIRWRRWFPIVFLGETLWTGGLVLLGYFAAEGIKHLERGAHFILLSVSLGFAVVMLWLVPRAVRQSNLLSMPSEPETRDSLPLSTFKKRGRNVSRQRIGTN